MPLDCTLSLFTFSDMYLSENISLASFYRNERDIQTLSRLKKIIINKHFWEIASPIFNIERTQNDVYEKTTSSFNLLLFFTDSTKSSIVGLDNLTSRSIAQGILEKLSNNLMWKQIPLFDPHLGNFILFHRNYLMIKGK